MNVNIFMAIYSLLFGLALGSFLNVCIYRIPLKKSIVRPASGCPNCGHKIKFYDNIPLISYLLLRGKCRYCGQGISWQYPTVETMTGLLSLALFTRYGLSYQYGLFLIFISLLLTISFIDLHYQIIPDILSLPGIVVGFAGTLIFTQMQWLESLLGILIGYVSFFLVAIGFEYLTGKEGMGLGDAKLLAMIGAWMGWKSLLPVVMISSLSGALIGTAGLLLARKGLKVRIPFGPFLSMGAMCYFFFGPQLIRWYLGLFL